MLLFYAAVHAVNHIIYCGADVTGRYDHQKRLSDIATNGHLKKLERKYRELMTLSETTRYKPYLHLMTLAQAAHAEKLSREFISVCGISIPED